MASQELSVFLDQINLNDLNDTPREDETTLQRIDNMNMYDLLLSINSKPKDTTHSSPSNRIYSANAIDSIPPISTINPKQLNSSKAEATVSTIDITASSSSASTSSNSSSLALAQSHVEETLSISSLDDYQEESQHDKKRNSFNNWSMNDEFNKAIQTWLSQNEKISKGNNLFEHPQRNVIKTSLNKRRKSDSQVAFRGIHSLNLNSSQPSTKQSTPMPRHSSISIPSSAHLASALIETNDDEESYENSQNVSTTNLNEEEEKPFKCDSCPKAFRRSEHLKRHIRSVHSNIRPFPCKFCEKKFSRSDNLAQHLRTHNKQSQSLR